MATIINIPETVSTTGIDFIEYQSKTYGRCCLCHHWATRSAIYEHTQKFLNTNKKMEFVNMKQRLGKDELTKYNSELISSFLEFINNNINPNQ